MDVQYIQFRMFAQTSTALTYAIFDYSVSIGGGTFRRPCSWLSGASYSADPAVCNLWVCCVQQRGFWGAIVTPRSGSGIPLTFGVHMQPALRCPELHFRPLSATLRTAGFSAETPLPRVSVQLHQFGHGTIDFQAV